MTRSLKDYVTEAETWIDSPSVGDDFAINIREECLVESHIVAVVEDGVVLAADEGMIEILESYGMLEGVAEGKPGLASLQKHANELVKKMGHKKAMDHALMMANLGRDPSWLPVIRYIKAMKEGQGVAEDLHSLGIWQEVMTAFSKGWPDAEPIDLLQPIVKKHGISFEDLDLLAQDQGYKDIYDAYDDFDTLDEQGVAEVKGHGESDPLKNREKYANQHNQGQVYKKTYPGDKVGMSKSYAYDIKRTGPKGVLPEQGVAEGFKDDRLKGCRCQKKHGDNKNCPIHGVKEGVAESAFDNYSPMAQESILRGVVDIYQRHIADAKKKGNVAEVKKLQQKLDAAQQKLDQVWLRENQDLRRIQELAGMPPAAMPAVTEGGVKNWISDLYGKFNETYEVPVDISDDDYLEAVEEFLRDQGVDPDRIEDVGELFLDMRDQEEDDDHDYANQLDAEQYDDENMMEDPAQSDKEIDYNSLVVDGIDTKDYPDFADAYFASGEYTDGTPIPDDVLDDLARDSDLLYKHIERQLYEAKYQGREVSLGKPFLTPDGPKKRSVYVKNPKGNVVKVNFGDKKLRIKKSNPKRRKSFRARHHCANPGPRHKARYWSCRFW